MRSGIKLVLLATVCSTALAFSAGSALANTYCVGLSPCVGGTPEPGIQAAFDAAGTHVGDDTVLIGTLGSPYVGDFNYGYQSETVSVIGVGSVKPVIQATPGLVYAMKVNSTSSALTQNLAFVAPNEHGGTGLAWSGTADGISVTHAGSGKEVHLLFPYGDATLVNSAVRGEGGGFGNGISLQLATGFTMRDSSLVTDTRVGLDTTVTVPSVILQRAAITANTTALTVGGVGSEVIAQQVFLKATSTFPTSATVSLLDGTHLDATHATIVRNGTGRGITVGATNASSLAELTNSVIADVEDSAIVAGQPGHAGVVNFSHSAIPNNPTALSGGSVNTNTGTVIGAATFVGAAAGDYHLQAPQPLTIDAGDPADTTTLDLTGKPRIVNGRSDLGAFEYQRSVPAALITAPATIRRSQAATFSASASSDPDPGDTLSFAWASSDGGSGTGASFVHTFATDGAKTVTLTATDQLGLSASVTSAVIVPGGPKFTIGKPKPNKARTKVTYKIGCPKAEKTCKVRGAIASGVIRARSYSKPATVLVKGGSSKLLTLKLNKAALKLIKSKRKLKTKVTFVGSDAAGNSRTVVQKYTAKAGKSGSVKDQR